MNIELIEHGNRTSSLKRIRLPADGFKSHALSLDQPVRVTNTPDGFTVEYADRKIAAVTITSLLEPVIEFRQPSDEGAVRPDLSLLAVLEAIFTCNPDLPLVKVRTQQQESLQGLLASGAIEQREGIFISRPELLFQLPELWQGGSFSVYPDIPTVTNGVHHPLRGPKPSGRVYERFIPWLNKSLGFHVADVDGDLEHFHRWMNDPRVAAIWEDDGDLDYHREFISGRFTDPRTLPLIGTFDGVPFGYFELYWAKEDRLGAHYDAEGHDRGWHVAIGEDAFRGKAFVSAWLPSLMHYIFLADPRTRRIVGEPVHHHQQQIRNLDRSGFAKIKHISFPHKRALLVMLLRERFFADKLLFPDLSGLADEHGLPPLGSLNRSAE